MREPFYCQWKLQGIVKRLVTKEEYNLWRGCQIKTTYETPEKALGHKDMRAYQCSYCGKWHRTTKGKHNGRG